MNTFFRGIILLLFLVPQTVLSDESGRIDNMQRVASGIRTDRGLPVQELDEGCCQIAQRWADYLARNNRFHHGGGEQIIARGYVNAQSAFSAWMRSPGHRRWVLSRNGLCGWGCQKNSRGILYWVGVFRKGIDKVIEQEVAPKRFYLVIEPWCRWCPVSKQRATSAGIEFTEISISEGIKLGLLKRRVTIPRLIHSSDTANPLVGAHNTATYRKFAKKYSQ